jgi:hypothetical protein
LATIYTTLVLGRATPGPPGQPRPGLLYGLWGALNRILKLKNGRTPLSYAAENEHETVMTLLLEKGAEPDSKAENGWTPLSYAAENRYEMAMTLLLEKGAELEVAVKLLLKGTDMKSKDKNGWTPPLSAVVKRRKAAVQLLMLMCDTRAD